MIIGKDDPYTLQKNESRAVGLETDVAVANPSQAKATVIGLLRGILLGTSSSSAENAALGTPTQVRATDGTATAWTVIQLLKGIIGKFGTLTDRSAAITAGGTAQQAAAANTARRYFIFQNHSDTDMWINFGVAAVAAQPSFKIVAGGSYENPQHFCPTELVSVICATTGKQFTCKES